MGRDQRVHGGAGCGFVSIHAPAWGATSSSRRISPPQYVSIHAPAWGATLIAYAEPRSMRFQSTRPHGARPVLGRTSILTTCFNPRARMGRDVEHEGIIGVRPVSIHAPAWGATSARRCCNCRNNVSIHAPAWGATRRGCPAVLLCPFQSTRPHGARLSAEMQLSTFDMFQSTRPHGARPHMSLEQCISTLFQSTRPHGARPKPIGVVVKLVSFNPRARMGRDLL